MDYSDWLTKEQAAAKLDVSVKTVERLAIGKRLQKRMRRRAGGSPLAVFNPESVERLLAERAATEEPVTPEVVAERQELATANPSAASEVTTAVDLGGFVDAIRALAPAPEAVPLAEKPRLTLREAVALGYQADDLRNRVRAGSLTNVGTPHRYRFRRRDLDAL